MRLITTGIAALLLAAASSLAQPYTAQRVDDHGVAVVRLTDVSHAVEVSIVPSIGNVVAEMKVHGHNIVYFPFADMGEFAKRPGQGSIPLLAPWGNRLNEQGFWANGKKYTFNMGLNNIRGGAVPIHGLLSNSPLWRVTQFAADANSAHVTSRLEFWKEPDLMAQWPFAHEYEMTYSLVEGVLEVRLTITNLSSQPMPVAVAFHSYYRIPDISRDEWTVHFPARQRVVTDEKLIATGEFKPMDLPQQFPLKGRAFDDGFFDLERDSSDRAHFTVEAAGRTVDVAFGPKYPAAVVYAPVPPANQPGQTRDFICFEPMACITNGINLAHDKKYQGLQSIPAGGSWTESFWVRGSGI